MKKLKWLILNLFSGIITLMLVLSSYAVNYKKGDKLNVLASSLNMRNKPSIKAKKTGRVPYGAKITALETSTKSFTSEGIKGHWVKVKYGKRIGYIFDGYLTKLPAPPKNCKGFKHYANSKLGKIGKKQTKKVQKKREIYINSWQNYKYNAILEESESYEMETDNGYSDTILKLKNISMEEAFLIGRLCSQDFRNKAFKVNSKGKINLEKKEALGISYLRIEKGKKEYIFITFGYSS